MDELENKHVLKAKAIGLAALAVVMMVTLYLPWAILGILGWLAEGFVDGAERALDSDVSQYLLKPLHSVTDKLEVFKYRLLRLKSLNGED